MRNRELFTSSHHTGEAEPVDLAIAQLAAPQHGVVSTDQLRRSGLLDANAIAYRVRIGRLHRLFAGVYAVGHRPPSPLARVMAAVLACGAGAAASHPTAGALWVIHGRHGTPIHVTARTARRHPGIVVHRSRTLEPADVTTHFGIPVTTPARTLVDLAQTLGDEQLMRAANEARVRHLLTLDALASQLQRSRGRRLGPLIELVAQAPGPTRSELEDAFRRFIARHRLPMPEINARVAGREVDALWPEHRLVAELDSRAFHLTERAFEEDRLRDAELLALGYRVIRITWRRLTREPAAEAARLRVLLGVEDGYHLGMAKDHGSSVKNDKQYEGLRKKGMNKQRAAAISNANAGSGNSASSKGGKKSSSGGGSSQSSKSSGSGSGGNRAQKQAAGRKGGKATASKS